MKEPCIFLRTDLNRMKQKMFVADIFLKEKPGTGKDEYSTRYKYCVGILSNKNKIYVTRPGSQKEGLDFVISVLNFEFFNKNGDKKVNLKNVPSHEAVYAMINELIESKKNRMISLIRSIYDCETDISNILSDNRLSIEEELVLHLSKWFFIEQDLRYWNRSGRMMFMFSLYKKILYRKDLSNKKYICKACGNKSSSGSGHQDKCEPLRNDLIKKYKFDPPIL